MWAGGGHRASPHLPRAIWQLLPWAVWPHSTRAPVVGAEQTESHFTGGPGGLASQRSWAQVCAELLCHYSSDQDKHWCLLHTQHLWSEKHKAWILSSDRHHLWKRQQEAEKQLNSFQTSISPWQSSRLTNILGLLHHLGKRSKNNRVCSNPWWTKVYYST